MANSLRASHPATNLPLLMARFSAVERSAYKTLERMEA